MAKILSNHLFATLLLAAVVLVKSLPTSVLVDTKQQQTEKISPDSLASHKGKLIIQKRSKIIAIFQAFKC